MRAKFSFKNHLCGSCGLRHTRTDNDGNPGVCFSCRLGLPKKRLWRTIERDCTRCHKPFLPIDRAQWYCWNPCRRPAQTRCTGQAGTYYIEGMTPAEFAFQIIMQKRGIRVRKLGPHSKRFSLNGTMYRPDFYERKRRIYYEVCGTRQALHQSKPKIAAMKRYHPKVCLLVVRPDGVEITP